MRFLSLLHKAAVENLRDWKMLSLVVSLAPFFVFIMHAYFHEAASPHRLVVVNRDVGVPTGGQGVMSAGQVLIGRLREAEYPDGRRIFQVEVAEDLARARRRLAAGSVDLVLELPEDLTSALLAHQRGDPATKVVVTTFTGPGSASYVLAAVWSDLLAKEFSHAQAGASGPLDFRMESPASSASLTEYETYVPGLLALAVMMLMFTAAATLIREKDQGTLVRLRMSGMRTSEWIAAVSVSQVVLGVVAVGLTLLTAVVLDYRTSGSLVALIVITALASLSVMAIGVIVAAVLRSNFDLVTIGCFPFFILMFFSGGMFPLPRVRLFDLGTRSVELNDVLPTTHTIEAYDRVLNRGAGLADVGFEVGAMFVLTAVLFLLGTWMFERRHMRAG